MKKKIMLVCTLIMSIFIVSGCGNAKLKNGEEIVFSVNGKNISADSFYRELRNKYGSAIMIDMIDKKILDVVYKDDKDIETQAKNQLETLKTQYANDWEKTLKSAGYDNENDLYEYFVLSYQRNKAVEDYIEDKVTEEEIKNYYNENTVGDISAKHILIKVKDESSENSEGLTDEEAKKKAEDLIKKIDEGADFGTLAKENSDDEGSAANGGDLGFFNKGEMVKEFEDAAYDLKVDKYTKEPVKTSYGYHIILKTGEKDKPKLKAVKQNIIEALKEEKKKEDPTLEVTALVELRKEYKLKFKDSKSKSLYKKYIETSKEAAKESANNANSANSAN